MEKYKARMLAYLIDLDKIEVQYSNHYYQGMCTNFYLRDLNNGSLISMNIVSERKDEKDHYYYFENVKINLYHQYQVVDGYGLSETLQYTKLVNMPRFDEVFQYHGHDLGATYTPDETLFKVWAPTALEVMVKVENQCYTMKRNEHGVFSVIIDGDLDNKTYVYLVKHHLCFHEAVDPYAYGSRENNQASVVVDIDRFDDSLYKEDLPDISRKTDAIIYEASVRDFTMDESIHATYPGKFLSMVESGLKTPGGHSAGIDYLVELGITHLQLMPIFDFATVDELHQKQLYNWGYDPIQYGIPEGSYALDPHDGYSRIQECREMVQGLHKKGIRVIMDVVYNHMYDVNDSAFESIVPGYYFRKNDQGELSNGSWCGNDLNTKAWMVRQYIKDMCKRWQVLYGIDGFRFDLMGIIDVETLNQVYRQGKDIDRHFMMYGEGWNMDTALDNEEKGMQDNHDKLVPIGFFNDYFRDTLKGGSGDQSLGQKGYFTGNMYNCEISGECMKAMRYQEVVQSINYLECHDNATIYDKLLVCNQEENEETRKKRQLMMNMTLLLSQGIPFIHCGQEFYRSKGGRGNTYNCQDDINKVDWSLVDKNRYSIDTIKKLISLRKENIAFGYETKEEVNRYVSAKHINYEVLRYGVKQDVGIYKEIVAYINPSYCSYQIDDMAGYDIIYNDNDSRDQLSAISMKIFGLKR